MFRAFRPDQLLPSPAHLVVVGAVFLAYGARAALEPIMQGNHPYFLFYPVLLVAAYVFGRGPAAVGAGLSAALGFWTFAEPAFGVGAGADTLTPLLFFLITSAVAIYLITELRAALSRLAADQRRLQDVADAHTSLFKDLQARMAHHMGLVASVLSFQARGEPDPEVLALLRKAGERSQLIAQAHRSLSGDDVAAVDFTAFSRALARIVCLEAAQSPDRVEVLGDSAPVRTEVATSLGVALAECLAWILGHKPCGVTRLRVDLRGGRLSVGVSHQGSIGAEIVALAPAAFMFRAMVEQLGAVVEMSEEEGAPRLELSVPLAATPERAMLDATLH